MRVLRRVPSKTNFMRLAVIAPHHEIPVYEHAAARTNGLFELSHFVTDLDSTAGVEVLLTKTAEFDACVMLWPNAVSREQLDRLAAAGKHLLSNVHNTTPNGLEQIAATWQAAGAHHAVATPRRFSPYAKVIRDGIASDRLGSPGLLRVHHWLDRNNLNSNVELQGVADQQWVSQTLVEEIDLACWLMGCEPDVVFGQWMGALATGDDGEGPGQGETSQGKTGQGGVVVHLGFDGGGMALIDVAIHEASAFYTATLIGSRGAAYADDHHNTNLLLKGKTRGVLVSDALATSSWLRPQLESFVKQAMNAAQPDSTVTAMQLATRVAHAATLHSANANKVAQRIGDTNELQ